MEYTTFPGEKDVIKRICEKIHKWRGVEEEVPIDTSLCNILLKWEHLIQYTTSEIFSDFTLMILFWVSLLEEFDMSKEAEGDVFVFEWENFRCVIITE